MIPSWLFSIRPTLPSALLVWGSICLLVLLCMGAGLATHFLLLSAPSLLQHWRGWRERRRYHLTLAEWDSRKQIGMPLCHTERLAYELEDPEWWDELEELTWPHGEWLDEITGRWRGQP